MIFWPGNLDSSRFRVGILTTVVYGVDHSRYFAQQTVFPSSLNLKLVETFYLDEKSQIRIRQN